MAELGRYHSLTVTKLKDFGCYLDAGELGEVLLPAKYVPAGTAVHDSLRIFLYLDSEDRPVATTGIPHACVGQFAYLRVVDTTTIGAFLDWGLEKDLFVPLAEQHQVMETGRRYLVYLYLDRRDGRIVGTSRIDHHLDKTPASTYRAGQAVDLIVANSTELGFKAIVNHRHWGVLYKDEVHTRLSFGQSLGGFIKQVRPDGKLDLTLHSRREVRDAHASRIEEYLQQCGGHAPVHDKTDPQEIARRFGMSKAAFKKAIGGLYKARIIAIEKDGIRLLTARTVTNDNAP